MTTFTIQVDDVAAEKVRALAAARGVPVEQLIAVVAEWFAREQDGCEADWTDQDAADFAEATAQFARGEGIPHEKVMADARARLRAR